MTHDEVTQDQIADILKEARYIPDKDENGNPVKLTPDEIKNIARNTFANNILNVHDEWGLTFQQIADICRCSRYAVFRWRAEKSCSARMVRLNLLARYINRPIQFFFYDDGIHKEPEKWPKPSIRIPPLDVLNFQKDVTDEERLLLSKPYLTKDPKELIEKQMKLFSDLPISSQESILHMTTLEHSYCKRKKTLVSQRMITD